MLWPEHGEVTQVELNSGSVVVSRLTRDSQPETAEPAANAVA